jgi:hypothetical protein
MNTKKSALAGLLALVCALVPAGAASAAVKAELRVQGGQLQSLDAGNTYKTGTETMKSSDKCGSITEKKHTIKGATAMGILETAQRKNKKLRPVRVSDTFGFALITCQIGDFGAFTPSKFWGFKVNHKFSDVAADLYELQKNDEVLWFFSNSVTGTNTGDELVLKAPSKVNKGQEFAVHVDAYDFAGNKTPASGVAISGGTFPPTDANGRSVGSISSTKGFAKIRGTRGFDIPTAPKLVCERGGKRCPTN